MLLATRAALVGASRPADDSAVAACTVPITVYGYRGSRICGFEVGKIEHPNGKVEVFVVGANYAIYHIWQGSGGWKSLGGRARTQAPNGVYIAGLSIFTFGTDNRYYCRKWPWTEAWHLC